MKARRHASSNRTFRWGLDPLFARGPLVAPPTSLTLRPGLPAERQSVLRSRQDRRRLLSGIAASLAIHTVALAVWQASSSTSEGALGALAHQRPQASDPMEFVNFRAPPREESGPPAASGGSESAVPVARVSPPALARQSSFAQRLSTTRVRAQSPNSLAGLASLPGMGDGVGSSIGDGESDGSGEMAGNGSAVYIAPRARSILRTWRPPDSVLGTEVLARILTDAAGVPTGPIELLPPTGHRETDDEIVYRVRNLDYWPATLNGEPIGAWAEITFEFCYKGTTAASPPSPGFQVGAPCEGEPVVPPATAPTRVPKP
jgi:hypothetical protein